MADQSTSDAIEAFFDGLDRWKTEAFALREIVDGCGLEPAWKWKQPCYGHGGTNLLMIAPFAKYCARRFPCLDSWAATGLRAEHLGCEKVGYEGGPRRGSHRANPVWERYPRLHLRPLGENAPLRRITQSPLSP